MPEPGAILDEVAIVLLASNPADLHLQFRHRRDILHLRGPDVVDAGGRYFQAVAWDLDEHVLVGAARNEARAVVKGKRIEVERALRQPEGLVATAVREINDVLQRRGAGAHAEIVGVDVHDSQRHMVRARMVEARPHQPPRSRALRNNGATRLQSIVDVVRHFSNLRPAGKQRGSAVRLIPVVDRDVNQLGDLRLILGGHRP